MLFWGQLNEAEIHIAPIIGIVCGALYSFQDYEEEEVREYTLQCCIFVISITIIWQKNTNG
jgi:hypothetical protein